MRIQSFREIQWSEIANVPEGTFNHDATADYRTKRVVLEIYDAMAEAQRTSQPDPPPADPCVAHPPRA